MSNASPSANDFETALARHRAGDLAGAEIGYRRILAADPSRADARHSLGLIYFQRGQFQDAVAELSEAVELSPGSAAAHNHLGAAMVQMGELAAAVTELRKATELDPGSAEAHFNLGCALRAQHDPAAALASFQRAVELGPDFAPAWFNLGNELRQQKRLDDAMAAFRRVLAIQPGHEKATRSLALTLAETAEVLKDQGQLETAHTHLSEAIQLRPELPELRVRSGLILQALDQPVKAEAAYREALQLRPEFPEALGNLAGALSAQRRHEEAVEACDTALRLRQEFPEVMVNRANALWALGRQTEAMTDYQRAVVTRPDFVDGQYNLGKALAELNRIPEAMRHFEEALRLDPNHVGTHFARALEWLRAGDFERGWAEYEWRWQLRQFGKLDRLDQLWDGVRSISGKTFLVRCEQGLGDFIHFIRYAPELKRLGATVVVECPRPLLPIMRSLGGVDRLLPRGDHPGEFDWYAPLFSLPRLLKTTLQTVPARVPYLSPTPELIEKWRARLAPLTGYRIGVAWEGNPDYPRNQERSFPLSALEPIRTLPGVHLISLLPGKGGGEIHVLGDDLDTEAGAFMDTAAVIRCLDLVIGCDSALAHLAGALGAPTWLALDTVPDWRWMSDREDSPWYPAHRIFRQAKAGDWTPVFSRMHDLLSSQMNQPRTVTPSIATVTTEISPGELFDKITILELKNERITDPAKLVNVRLALKDLEQTRDANLPASPELERLVAELRGVNGRIWDVEDELRHHERRSDFGPEFIERARSVYRENDRRAALKREIDEMLGSRLLEEKSYTAYQNHA
jgi:tetratricopeptide (TPR) repeat protein